MLAATAAWYGSIPTWAILLAVLIASRQIAKGKAGDAVGILQKANEVLAERVHELETQRKTDAAKITQLQTRTDYSLVMQDHERNAQNRADAQLKVLNAIAEKINNG